MATKFKTDAAAHKEATVTCDDPSVLQVLVGDQDSNLKLIERELGVDIGTDPTGLFVKGNAPDVELASDLLTQLRDIIVSGESIFPGDVERSLRMLSGNRRLKLQELYRDSLKIAGRRYTVVPKTVKQKVYLDSIRSSDLTFGIGPAGTGKTYLAMAMAVSALMNKEVKRVILCRPAVEAGEKLGFLPGDMAEKVNPYLRPLYDALHDMMDHEKAKDLIEKGVIEVAPLAFMRGRTLSNAFVILDEAQNTTVMQMKMFLTRLGFNSKCVVTGDTTQIDLPRGNISGLVDAIETLRDVEGLSFVTFAEEDVVRHRLVSRIVSAYERKAAQASSS